MVASGASTIKVGVGVLSDHLVSDISVKRVHMTGDDEHTQSAAASSSRGGDDFPGMGGGGGGGGAVGGKIEREALEPFDDELGGDVLALSGFKLDSGREGVVVEEGEGRARGLPLPTAAVSPKQAEGVVESSDPWESGIEEGRGKPRALEEVVAPAEPEPPSSDGNNKPADKKDWEFVEFDSGSEGDPLSHRSVYGDDTNSRSNSARSGSVDRGDHRSSSSSSSSARSGSDEVVVRRAGSGSAPARKSRSGSDSDGGSRGTSGGVPSDSGSDNE